MVLIHLTVRLVIIDRFEIVYENYKKKTNKLDDDIKPTAASILGALGGLLLVKSVKKLCVTDKEQNQQFDLIVYLFCFSFCSLFDINEKYVIGKIRMK